MTEYETNVIALLKLIAHGQRVMIDAMPKMIGRDDVVRGYGQLCDSVFAELQSSGASPPEFSEQTRSLQGTDDGTGNR